jgi:hypothetical protein
MNAENSSATQVLWGTNINANEVQSKLKNFINTFMEDQNDENDDQDDNYLKAPYYVDQLKQIKEIEEYVLDVNCDHIYQFD